MADLTQSTGGNLIAAERVNGTNVYNLKGEKLGHVEDIVLDKMSNNIEFAVLGFGGVLGMGEKFHPIPWSVLSYDEDKGGYVVPYSKDVLKNAPAYDINDLTKHDGQIRDQSFSYYKVERYWE